MKLAFLTLLLKDGTKSVGRGIAINSEGFLEVWLSEDGGGANSVDKGIKCGVVFIVPVESAAFSTVGDKRVEQGGKHAEVANIHAVKVEKAKKGT